MTDDRLDDLALWPAGDRAELAMLAGDVADCLRLARSIAALMAQQSPPDARPLPT